MAVVRELSNLCAQYNTSWCVKRCRRAGCQVRLTNLPKKHIIFDIEAHQEHKEPGLRCCDFLIGYEEGKGEQSHDGLIAIELMEQIRASKVEEQLRRGTIAAERLLKAVDIKTFIPVAVGHPHHRYEIEKLREHRICFKTSSRTFSMPIEIIDCDAPLAGVLDKVARAEQLAAKRRPAQQKEPDRPRPKRRPSRRHS